MPGDKETPRKFHIRVDLDKIDEEKFTQIQEKYKLKNKSEVLRFCVNKVYHGVTLEIDEDIIDEIQKIVSNRYIKLSNALMGVDDFIKRAITEYYLKLREQFTLNNWNIRTSLPEEERDVATALVNLQLEKPTGVTMDDLMEYLDKDEQSIRKYLEKFLADVLLESTESQGKIYYSVR